MSTIIIEIEGGIPSIAGPDQAEIAFIDWDMDPDNWDYDTCYNLISEVMGSSLDGPTQFRIMARIIDRGLQFMRTTA
jgi:hypothetical protein